LAQKGSVHLSKQNKTIRLQISTLVDPMYGKRVGEFCQTLKMPVNQSPIGTPNAVQLALGNQSVKPLLDAKALWTNRINFDFRNFKSCFTPFRDKDFIAFGADNGTAFCLWEFFINQKKIDEIWENSQIGQHIQIFDVYFEQADQVDPTLRLSQIKDELLFTGEAEAMLGIGFLEHHQSVSISQYLEITGYDPVLAHAKRRYHDPDIGHWYREKMTFEYFLERERSRFFQII